MEIKKIDITENQTKIAIVAIGYNRLVSLARLLDSLLNAEYHTDAPLIISIDCSGCTELYDFVQNFEWPFGDKYVNIQQKRLGLKNHIFQCGDLSKYFKAVILLEDDTFVAPDFYKYMSRSVEKYTSNEDVASIAGYFNEMYGYVGLPYAPMCNGFDVFASQEVSSTGECFTYNMWQRFRDWLADYDLDNFNMESYELPIQIKQWRRAWTKYFNAYLVEKNKYSIYPQYSIITNCGDAGDHNSDPTTMVQVKLMMGHCEYLLPDFDSITKYDIFGNNMALYGVLNLNKQMLCLDLYGNNPNANNRRYILTIKKMPFEVVRSFGLSFRPQELNIILGIEGNDICLYDTTKPTHKKVKSGIPDAVIRYHLQGFNIWFLLQIVIRQIKNHIKHRLHLQ
ncbi:MAG: hypothetical protein RR061_09635 [Muribaculaceae bacterium]